MKMAKRIHDESSGPDAGKDARREAKRLKKERKAKKTCVGEGDVEAAATDLVTSKDDLRGNRNGKNGTEMVPTQEQTDLKRSKEKETASAQGTQEAENVVDADANDTAAARAARKALRKAEKAARKASRAADGSGSATPTSNVEASGNEQRGDVVMDVAYQEHRALAALPQCQIDEFVSEKRLSIEDPDKQAFRPILSFEYLPVEKSQRATFASFAAPTPIQAAVWPYLFAGRDVVGVAETGSGKTLAFGLPCVRYIASLEKKQRKSIQACMVSPTRELALQIHEQMEKIANPAGLKVTCIYGGTNKDVQRAAIKNAHIVVATPGRLNDFIQEGSIDLSHVRYMVLDEADRMLDKGFEEDVRKIISATSITGRQTLMFTATWPQSVRELAETFMTKPVRVTIGDNASGELRANTRIVQEVEVMTQQDKQPRLIQILKQYQSGQHKNDRILVFCLYKKEATRIEEFIRRRGFNVAGIHGDLSQQKRTESLEAFKVGKVPVLVATDVAARGLDIPAVKLVINVTFPLTAEDYVHRIGRTGRAGQDGKAITFFTDAEKPLAGALINVLKAADQPVPEELMKFGTTVKKKQHEAYGAFFKDGTDMKKATKITFD
ncbi:hypothetical protein M433DRAFT_242100 [Acidomyces richmondensis BFW]|nr:hypothetical protein M433DRAFT_242100 [Acidomyces richmondensis BFW]